MKTAAKLRSLMTNLLNNRIRRNMSLSMLQGLVGVATTLLIYRILLTETSIEVLGLWSLTVGIVSFVRIADVSGGAGLNRLVAVALLNDKGPSGVIDTVTLFVLVLYCLLGVVLAQPLQAAVTASVDFGYRDLSATLVLWAVCTLPCMVLSTCHLNALDGMHRADIRSGLQISGFAIYLIGAVVLIPRVGVVGLAAAQMVQLAVVTLVARLTLMRLIPDLHIIPLQFSWTELRAAIGYGAKLQVSNIAQLISEPGMRLVVNHFSDLAVLAVFDIAQKLTSQVSAVAASAARPLVPEFSRSHELERGARNQLFVRMLQVTIPVAALAYTSVCVIGPLICWFVLGYIPKAFLFNLACLAAGWCFFTIGIPSLLLARGAGELRWNIIGQWTIAVGSIVLGSLIGSFHGSFVSLGIGIALLLGTCLQMLGNAQIYQLPIAKTLISRPVRLAAATFAVALTGLLLVANLM